MNYPVSNWTIISRNSFWYGLETGLELLLTVFTNIVLARILGPNELGEYSYIIYLVIIVERLGALGIPGTTSKYMAEYFGRGEGGVAREIFFLMLGCQAVLAVVIAGSAITVAVLGEDARVRMLYGIAIASILPSMVNSVASQANIARENLAANLPSAFLYLAVYLIVVIGTIVFGFGLIGLAVALLAARSAECIARLLSVHKWVSRIPPQHLDRSLRRKLFQFSGNNLAIMALTLIVWDRSEVLFLRHYCDRNQIAFYTLSFSLIQRLLVIPRAFSGAIGTTMLAQYGRDPARLHSLVFQATRYLALIGIPLFLGVAVTSGAAVKILYGVKYEAVAPLLWIASVLALPRLFQQHGESLFLAHERQGVLIRWMLGAAVVNVCLDFSLIPRYGALGATIANGTAQAIAIAVLWYCAREIFQVELPLKFIAAVLGASAIMALVIAIVVQTFGPVVGLSLGIPCGMMCFLSIVRTLRLLTSEDSRRLSRVRGRCPLRLQGIFDSSLAWLIPEGETAVV